MGLYTGYLNSNLDFGQITEERKTQLKRISELRNNRDILVIASDLSKNGARIQIDYTDILAVQDQTLCDGWERIGHNIRNSRWTCGGSRGHC